MARQRPEHATLYDFRDLDIMLHIAEHGNGGIETRELAELLGFDVEETTGRPVGMRMAHMRKYGMVVFDPDNRLWSLSRGGERVIEARIKAPQLKVVEQMPDELMIETMAHITSRFQRGDTMLGQMLRREFKFGTGMR